ncbi:MAG: DUF1826 domain-containing protein [Acidiferrobacterales bacterium]|nr:DUF1826 domain-containing protein [Acidiferrobacterales bacterium]
MRQVISNQLGDFAAIYDEDVEIISVSRPQANACESLSNRLISSRQVLQKQWVQSADDAQAPANELSAVADKEMCSLLFDQITEASEMLGELMGCKQVGVRVVTLKAPMCPRFHVDYVPCRMLITLTGEGTEWIPNSDVDRDKLADRESKYPPIHAGRQIQQLATGCWSLLKGGAWNKKFSGVVHRSPHGESKRLLLSIDPVF